MTRVRLTGVGKIYPGHGKAATPVVAAEDVSIEIASGEIHAIIGYSGAGKSTVLRLINGLERVSSGRITVGDTEITALSERELRRVRTGIGMIFQQFNLLHSKRVKDNVAYPLTLLGVPRAERATRVAELLSYVGLEDKAEAFIEQLSGGQKQRVGIARALASNPGVLLADEATSALDPETSQEVVALLKRVNEEFGITIVLVTHEMEVVRAIADRVTVMERGRIVEQGEVFSVFSDPGTGASQRFVATALPTTPTSEEIAKLRESHSGALVTVQLRDGGVDQPTLFRTLAELDVDVSIVHGGVTEAGGRSFGRVTFELTGESEQVRAGIERLSSHAEIEELTR